MVPTIPFRLLMIAAPLSAGAAPLTLQGEGFYHLHHKQGAISNRWHSTLPLEFDKKTILDRTKKESCSGDECTSFELLTQVTARDLGDGAVQMEVEFSSTSGDDVTRVTGNLIARDNESSKLDLKAEGRGGDHFGIHLTPHLKLKK